MAIKLPCLLLVSALSSAVLCSTIYIHERGSFIYPREEGAPDRVCTREGIMCKDCFTLVSCIARGDHFVENTTLLCPKYAPCDELKLACSPGGSCRYKKFQCPVGTKFPGEIEFPDPYSCNQYHGCTDTEVFDYKCPNGSSYNMITQDCQSLINSTNCELGPIPTCTSQSTTPEQIDGTIYTYKCENETGKYNTSVIYPQLDVKTDDSGNGTVLSV